MFPNDLTLIPSGNLIGRVSSGTGTAELVPLGAVIGINQLVAGPGITVQVYNTSTYNRAALISSTAGNLYILPTASTTILGGVKVDGTSITITNGVISSAAGYTLPIASASVLGGVKPDGTTISINATTGVITAVGSSATSITVGTTTVGSGTNGYVLSIGSGGSAGVLENLAVGLTGNSTIIQTTSGGLLTASILPVATTSAVGGIKIDGSTITISSSIASAWGGMATVNVVAYGADPTGSADSTTAIANAIAALPGTGGIVYFPSGTYKVSTITVTTDGVWLKGAGKYATVLAPSTTTGTFLEVGSGSSNNPTDFVLSDLFITPASTRTSGSTILIQNGHHAVIRDVSLWGNHYNGIELRGGSSQYTYIIDRCEINNCSNNGVLVGNSAGAVQDLWITNTDIAACSDGILFVYLSGGNLTDVGIITCTGHGIATYPGSNQSVNSLVCTNVQCDSATNECWWIGDNGGSIAQLKLIGCWGSTSTAAYGVLLNSANLNGVEIIGGSFSNNYKGGILLEAGANVLIDGAECSFNSQVGTNTYHGIAVSANVSYFSIVNCISGNTGKQLGTNYQAYGILINTGTSDYYTIQNNLCQGNATGTVNDAGSGTHKIVTQVTSIVAGTGLTGGTIGGVLGGTTHGTIALAVATSSTLGGVIPDGTIITVNGSGDITVAEASSSAFGVCKVDGTTITASGGVITASGGSATTITVGTTTVGSGTNGYVLSIGSGGSAGVLEDLPVGLTGNSTIVQTTSGGLLTASLLPLATTSTLGGVIVGTNIGVTSGTISVATATSSVLGVVKPDGTIITVSTGAITVAKASSSAFGVVEVDGSTITASTGVISASLSGLGGMSLTATGQAFSGGLRVTSFSIGTKSSGTYTPDQGNGPLQYLTNGGAFTLAAPTTYDGSITILVINNSSAGAITLSGFTVGSNTGDSLDTTNTHKFMIQITTIDGVATYNIKALQ